MATNDDPDETVRNAVGIVEAARANQALQPIVRGFFDPSTFTVSYVVHDPTKRRAAVIDAVLDFDLAAGRISYKSADTIIEYIQNEGLTVDWLLETHPHADHLTSAPYLQSALGGRVAIGEKIIAVQEHFGEIFHVGDDYARDGSDFDRLLADGDRIQIGSLEAIVLYVPGHTPADIAYVIGNAVFCGDTLFMPDSGTARTDFPGGDARRLYRSIRRLFALPSNSRLFVCHDYSAPGRDGFAWETSIRAQREANIHINDQVTEDDFVDIRNARDCTLAMPRLLLPSIQVNMRAGRLPSAENNGRQYLRLPLNAI